MRVLFITRGFPSEKDPMAGNYEAVQAKAIAAKGHDVSVIAIQWEMLHHFFRNGRVTHRNVDGINVYECTKVYPAFPHIPYIKAEIIYRRWIFLRVFEQYIKDNGIPDVIHAHIVTFAATVTSVIKKYHIPFIITEHFSKVGTDRLIPRIRNLGRAYFIADQVICVSKALAKSVHENFGIKSIVINNMVDNLFFQSSKVLRKDKQFRFIAVGSLRKIKNYGLLIDAFAKGKFPENTKLNIIGDGNERISLKRKIKENGLESQIKLLGTKTPQEVSELLCESDCLVLSSKIETFAIVAIEAMAKGLPVISTMCGGPETFIRPQDGILVPNDNAEVLAMAMKDMIKHYAEYDGREIRQHCYNNFSQDIIADKIIDVYKQVVTSNK